MSSLSVRFFRARQRVASGSGYFQAALFMAVIVAAAPVAWGQWTQVTSGVEYQKFTLSGPNNVFVTRMDRATTSLIIDTLLSNDTIRTGREKVSAMAARAEDMIGYWGQEWGKYRYDVVVAVNGDFFNLTTGVPTGGQLIGGWYAKRYPNVTGGSGFAWTLNRATFIGGCVSHTASKNKVTYPATAQEQYITDVDRARGTNELIIFTPYYDVSTQTDSSGAEVLVQMARPTLLMPTPGYTTGTVRAIYNGAGNTLIPFDHIVLSATGTAAAALLSNVSAGSEVRVSQEITHYQDDCATRNSVDWTKTYASAGGGDVFLKNGAPYDIADTNLNPRTAFAYNSTWIFLVVVDGRAAESIGMNMAQLANFCINYLGAADGINQDGGGSSTMWLDGVVRNHPSDATGERTVSNGIMIVQLVENVARSSAFAAGQNIITTTSATLRRGPGTNWSSSKSFAALSTGRVMTHPLNGVRAKGQCWWKCEFGSDQGWVSENEMGTTTRVDAWNPY
ncbi:MAG: phosphodiester glycosidase family protein [bacterium]|nr:phosphodiester glycosidase family protein [Candidatus Sumerlaeota bacterium]